MTTINNNQSSVGIIVGVIVTIAIAVIFFIFALPAIRDRNDNSAKVELNVPNPLNSETN